MKAKLFFILMFLFVLSTPSYSQKQEKLWMDKVNAEGIRTIGTFYHYLNTGALDALPVGFSFWAHITGEQTIYYLSIKMRNVTFPKDGALLIKTGTDDILEFKQLYNDYDTKSTHYIPYQGVIEMGTALYESSIEDFEQLLKEGIKKVRIETTGGLIDREYKPKKIEKYKSEIEVMLNLIKTETSKKKDIYSDF